MAGDPGSNSRVKFGPYEADIGEGVLRKSGTRVKLQKQPFQILTAMLARPNELITREYLREIVWSTDTFVDFEHGLNAAINKLRQALADSSTNPRYIQTVAGRGYRFIAPIEQAEMPAAVPLEGDAQPPAQAWAGGRMFARYWAGSILCGGILLGFVFGWLLHRPFKRPPQPQPLQFTIPIPDNLVFEPGFAHQEFAISPDGARLAFLAESQIWIHELSSAKTFPLTAARNVTNFAWSRDSQFFYFSELSDVRKVSISGGSSVGIFEMPAKTTWNALLEVNNKVALFTRSGDVFAVPGTGGKPAPALARDLQYIWPQLLPDGKLLHISFDKAIQSYQAWVSNPAQLQDRRQILRTDSRVQYSPPSGGRSQGYLLYIRGGTLVAHPFDAKNLRLYGEAKPIAEDVFWFQPTGAAAFSLSDNGLVIYRKWQNKSQLKWVDRRGHELEIIGKPNSFLTPLRLSPDQTRLAAAIYDSRKGGTDIWVYDLARHLESRLTHLVGQAASPIWAPDNQRFAFLLAKGARPKMYFKSLEESGKEQEFSGASDAFQLPTDWSRDGRFLLYQTSGSALPGARIVLLDLAHQGKRIPLLESSSQELGGVFSPNTSWVAFLSNETGQTEAYIQSFEAEPQPHLSGERQRISNDGASLIRWRADGKELYYLNGSNCVTAVSVNRLNGKLVIGSPQKLFHLESVSSEGAVAPGFDVSVDGQRFVIADPQPPRDAPFVVIQNWQKLIEP